MNKLFTDGGSRGNPGPAAIGGVLYSNDIKILEFKDYIGVSTNNEAEYTALIKGLTLALAENILDLECYLDSELVVHQLNGVYKVKTPHIQRLYSQVISLKGNFKNIKFIHIKRALNSDADALVNQALDARK